MAREASPPEPCSRTRRQTSPLPFLRPYRRMPAQQLPPRPTTSPAALPTGRVRGDRGLRRLGSGSPSPESTTTTTKMATRKALPGNTSVEAGDYTYAEEEERGPHGFTVPSPVSPPTDLISCPQSDSGYECSPLEQPPSYFPTPPIPSDRCPSQYHKGQRLNSHTRSISDSAIPSDPNGSSCTYHRDWTPQPLPAGIARPPGHPPTRDAIFAPPATPYPLALAGVNVVARPWTSGSSSSSSPTSFRSNKSSGSGSPIDWSPFRAKAATTAREGEAAKLWGWKRSLPWGLGSISQSHSTGGREGSNEAMTPLRAAPAPPLLPSRIRLGTQLVSAAGPPSSASLQPSGSENQSSRGPSLLTQILNARVWVKATSRVFGPTDPRTVAAKKEESARRVERANWGERIEASLGRTKELREWWIGGGHGRNGGSNENGKKVRFAEEYGQKEEKIQVPDAEKK